MTEHFTFEVLPQGKENKWSQEEFFKGICGDFSQNSQFGNAPKVILEERAILQAIFQYRNG